MILDVTRAPSPSVVGIAEHRYEPEGMIEVSHVFKFVFVGHSFAIPRTKKEPAFSLPDACVASINQPFEHRTNWGYSRPGRYENQNALQGLPKREETERTEEWKPVADLQFR